MYFIKEKSDTLEMFQKYIAMVKNNFKKAPAMLVTDNGGEYCSHDMQNLLDKE